MVLWKTENVIFDKAHIYSYRILQRLFKTTVIFLLLFYLIVPVFVKTNPWIQSKIIFLNNREYTSVTLYLVT